MNILHFKYASHEKNFCFAFFLNSLYASAPTHTFSKNKTFKHLLKLYESHPVTFFSEQPFNHSGELINQSCKKCPLEHVQWMPIVPYQSLAKDLLCFKEKLCIDKQGIRFKGLRCCQQWDPSFYKASADLFNYVPEVILIKQQRRHYHFVYNGKTNQKANHFSIDKKNKTIEVLPGTLGMIARTYLYMRDTYHLSLSEKEIALFLNWHLQYPPDAWERERNNKIKAIQGNSNLYVHG